MSTLIGTAGDDFLVGSEFDDRTRAICVATTKSWYWF